MRDFTTLQRDWFQDGLPAGVENSQELVEACEHDPEPKVTGVTQREYCPRCGKVLDETLMEYKYE